ncbi:hypothetical protein L226DRAFT_502352 [Lentinus tigrinus ALCF2SS1-7]|uniref:uncharacterized protein n=1 Tax=Lentinus tigrinus ALCF2SS1-7 TaxID=1328758 RepID=UPI001165E614|nr:hypothetical protein L226DRAFT_502352 [Lentinus tigrinus ALCF2SS1-7]
MMCDIFTHACTDGGYTGTSLTLVNKFFHGASHLVRFQSLSFSSLRQIQGFLSYIRAYQQKQHDSKLRIRHLLLSFPNAISAEPPSQDDVGPSQSLNVWYMMRQQREHEKAAWDMRFMQLVPSLLQLAAPHLDTLALLQSDAFAIPSIRTVLPRLRELTLLVGISVTLSDDQSEFKPSSTSPPGTVGGSLPPETGYAHFTLHALTSATAFRTDTAAVSAQNHSVSPTTTSATSSLGDRPHARFPALERLHMVCGRHRDWTLREPLAHLMQLAPALTHLRISNTTYTHGQDDSIQEFLRDALGMPSALVTPGDGGDASGGHTQGSMLAPSAPHQAQNPPGDEVAKSAGLPQLRRAVLHSVPPPDGGRCGNTHKNYCGLVGAVQAIADACECSEDVSVRWIEGERMRCKDWGRLIRAQWMDRITGGNGCWEDDGLKQTLEG